MNVKTWKDGEYVYCTELVRDRGGGMSRDPKTVASYLRLQAADACRDGEYEVSARLGTAATMINEDARNNHEPNWIGSYALLFAAMAPSSVAP